MDPEASAAGDEPRTPPQKRPRRLRIFGTAVVPQRRRSLGDGGCSGGEGSDDEGRHRMSTTPPRLVLPLRHAVDGAGWADEFGKEGAGTLPGRPSSGVNLAEPAVMHTLLPEPPGSPDVVAGVAGPAIDLTGEILDIDQAEGREQSWPPRPPPRAGGQGVQFDRGQGPDRPPEEDATGHGLEVFPEQPVLSLAQASEPAPVPSSQVRPERPVLSLAQASEPAPAPSSQASSVSEPSDGPAESSPATHPRPSLAEQLSQEKAKKGKREVLRKEWAELRQEREELQRQVLEVKRCAEAFRRRKHALCEQVEQLRGPSREAAAGPGRRTPSSASTGSQPAGAAARRPCELAAAGSRGGPSAAGRMTLEAQLTPGSYAAAHVIDLLVGDDVCAICLEPLRQQAQTIALCGHIFHWSCLNAASRTSCPQCRRSLDNESRSRLRSVKQFVKTALLNAEIIVPPNCREIRLADLFACAAAAPATGDGPIRGEEVIQALEELSSENEGKILIDNGIVACTW